MSNVTFLAGVRHQETIRTVRHILARAERGEIGGVNIVVDDLVTGEKPVVYTGSFRRDPGGLAALLGRLAVKLCGIADAEEGRGTGSDGR